MRISAFYRKKVYQKKSCQKRVNGEITVFLSLTLTCICALMCGLLESARVAGSGWYLQMAADSALDSLMSQYHRDVWEDYHLFLLEFEDKKELSSEMEPYLKYYLDQGVAYGLQNESILAEEPIPVTAQRGKYLEREIVDYMKLGVWTMERNPTGIKKLLDDIKEADSLGDITDHYQMDAEKILKLEKAVDAIGSSLKKQAQYLEAGKTKLRNNDGRGFISDAKKLEQELDKMPGLVSKYEKEAEALQEVMSKAKNMAEKKKPDLKAENWKALSAELDSYHTYTAQEKERSDAVKNVEKQALKNRIIVDTAIEEAKDVQDYIDDWDPDDEDDELDEEPLWRGVLSTVSRFVVDSSFGEPGIRDKKKMSVLEGISRLAGGDLLSIVMPEGMEVSQSTVDQRLFPSKTELTVAGKGKGTGEFAEEGIGEGTGEFAEEGTGKVVEEAAEEGTREVKDMARDLVNAAFIDEYAAYHFTNVLSEQKKKFQYEQEYILNGSGKDRENLKNTVNQIVKVRQAMNLLYLLRDAEKKNEARALAVLISGAAGIAPLTQVVTFFILTVWAFAESVEDVKILLKGGRVPFFKSKQDWSLSLDQMMGSGTGGLRKIGRPSAGGVSGGQTPAGNMAGSDTAGGQNTGSDARRGMNYQDYIKLFLLLKNRNIKDFRMMDMIQNNINLKQKGFLMSKCAYRVDIVCRAAGKYAVLKREASKAY